MLITFSLVLVHLLHCIPSIMNIDLPMHVLKPSWYELYQHCCMHTTHGTQGLHQGLCNSSPHVASKQPTLWRLADLIVAVCAASQAATSTGVMMASPSTSSNRLGHTPAAGANSDDAIVLTGLMAPRLCSHSTISQYLPSRAHDNACVNMAAQ